MTELNTHSAVCLSDCPPDMTHIVAYFIEETARTVPSPPYPVMSGLVSTTWSSLPDQQHNLGPDLISIPVYQTINTNLGQIPYISPFTQLPTQHHRYQIYNFLQDHQHNLGSYIKYYPVHQTTKTNKNISELLSYF